MNSKSHQFEARMRPPRRGFTLTELLIATVILLVVIIATSKIFGTASSVVGIGEATADVLQDATAIEQQIRQDFARMSRGGYLAIRGAQVPNDVNIARGGALLDPSLPDFFDIRSDQLVFFIDGVQNTRNFSASTFDNTRKQQASAARIYYGHAFQIPDAAPGIDPDRAWEPWRMGNLPIRDRNNIAGTVNVPFIPATRWLLARQAILLADDGSDSADFGQGRENSMASIWNDPNDRTSRPRNGRRDIASTNLSDIRGIVIGASDKWFDINAAPGDIFQTSVVDNSIYFPRAERTPPLESGDANNFDFVRRDDHALTTSVISTACSIFIVDWTYDDNVGTNPVSGRGIGMPRFQPKRWFGLPEISRGIVSFGSYVFDNSGGVNDLVPILNPVNPRSIELPVFNSGRQRRYKAYFGYNHSEPLDINDADNDPATRVGVVEAGYTPWPSAIRITMVLHDPEGRLEARRIFEFVVDLPRFDP